MRQILMYTDGGTIFYWDNSFLSGLHYQFGFRPCPFGAVPSRFRMPPPRVPPLHGRPPAPLSFHGLYGLNYPMWARCDSDYPGNGRIDRRVNCHLDDVLYGVNYSEKDDEGPQAPRQKMTPRSSLTGKVQPESTDSSQKAVIKIENRDKETLEDQPTENAKIVIDINGVNNADSKCDLAKEIPAESNKNDNCVKVNCDKTENKDAQTCLAIDSGGGDRKNNDDCDPLNKQSCMELSSRPQSPVDILDSIDTRSSFLAKYCNPENPFFKASSCPRESSRKDGGHISSYEHNLQLTNNILREIDEFCGIATENADKEHDLEIHGSETDLLEDTTCSIVPDQFPEIFQKNNADKKKKCLRPRGKSLTNTQTDVKFVHGLRKVKSLGDIAGASLEEVRFVSVAKQDYKDELLELFQSAGPRADSPESPTHMSQAQAFAYFNDSFPDYKDELLHLMRTPDRESDMEIDAEVLSISPPDFNSNIAKRDSVNEESVTKSKRRRYMRIDSSSDEDHPSTKRVKPIDELDKTKNRDISKFSEEEPAKSESYPSKRMDPRLCRSNNRNKHLIDNPSDAGLIRIEFPKTSDIIDPRRKGCTATAKSGSSTVEISPKDNSISSQWNGLNNEGITKAEYLRRFASKKPSLPDISLSLEPVVKRRKNIEKRRSTFTCNADNEKILKKIDPKMKKLKQTYSDLFGSSSDEEVEQRSQDNNSSSKENLNTNLKCRQNEDMPKKILAKSKLSKSSSGKIVATRKHKSTKKAAEITPTVLNDDRIATDSSSICSSSNDVVNIQPKKRGRKPKKLDNFRRPSPENTTPVPKERSKVYEDNAIKTDNIKSLAAFSTAIEQELPSLPFEECVPYSTQPFELHIITSESIAEDFCLNIPSMSDGPSTFNSAVLQYPAEDDDVIAVVQSVPVIDLTIESESETITLYRDSEQDAVALDEEDVQAVAASIFVGGKYVTSAEIQPDKGSAPSEIDQDTSGASIGIKQDLEEKNNNTTKEEKLAADVKFNDDKDNIVLIKKDVQAGGNTNNDVSNAVIAVRDSGSTDRTNAQELKTKVEDEPPVSTPSEKGTTTTNQASNYLAHEPSIEEQTDHAVSSILELSDAIPNPAQLDDNSGSGKHSKSPARINAEGSQRVVDSNLRSVVITSVQHEISKIPPDSRRQPLSKPIGVEEPPSLIRFEAPISGDTSRFHDVNVRESALPPERLTTSEITDRIVTLFSYHVYFYFHLHKAQVAFEDTLNSLKGCSSWFKLELLCFTNSIEARKVSKSQQLFEELCALNIMANFKLIAPNVLIELVFQRLQTFDASGIARQHVVLVVFQLLNGFHENISKIAIAKNLLSYCEIVIDRMKSKTKFMSKEQINQLLEQIEFSNNLISSRRNNDRHDNLNSRIRSVENANIYRSGNVKRISNPVPQYQMRIGQNDQIRSSHSFATDPSTSIVSNPIITNHGVVSSNESSLRQQANFESIANQSASQQLLNLCRLQNRKLPAGTTNMTGSIMAFSNNAVPKNSETSTNQTNLSLHTYHRPVPNHLQQLPPSVQRNTRLQNSTERNSNFSQTNFNVGTPVQLGSNISNIVPGNSTQEANVTPHYQSINQSRSVRFPANTDYLPTTANGKTSNSSNISNKEILKEVLTNERSVHFGNQTSRPSNPENLSVTSSGNLATLQRPPPPYDQNWAIALSSSNVDSSLNPNQLLQPNATICQQMKRNITKSRASVDKTSKPKSSYTKKKSKQNITNNSSNETNMSQPSQVSIMPRNSQQVSPQLRVGLDRSTDMIKKYQLSSANINQNTQSFGCSQSQLRPNNLSRSSEPQYTQSPTLYQPQSNLCGQALRSISHPQPLRAWESSFVQPQQNLVVSRLVQPIRNSLPRDQPQGLAPNARSQPEPTIEAPRSNSENCMPNSAACHQSACLRQHVLHAPEYLASNDTNSSATPVSNDQSPLSRHSPQFIIANSLSSLPSVSSFQSLVIPQPESTVEASSSNKRSSVANSAPSQQSSFSQKFSHNLRASITSATFVTSPLSAAQSTRPTINASSPCVGNSVTTSVTTPLSPPRCTQPIISASSSYDGNSVANTLTPDRRSPSVLQPDAQLNSNMSEDSTLSIQTDDDVETVDLTWIDDLDETELQIDLQLIYVKKEEDVFVVPSPADSGISSPPMRAEENTMVYTVQNLCICNKKANYICACQQAWYCGTNCQLSDWESHRFICVISNNTTPEQGHINST
ncbi:uncharacterized protein LOC132701511 isoform X2 [Cylas formicarius]|uniref:uncharacterized protein LOC132701511 isoform X2 n=1 Tax=Cylas formicarius TaxID=197179 RepID=UPI002958CABE|nr:uncharacterized protein LOC132701511 isoform X2 [Cylas formicarius]